MAGTNKIYTFAQEAETTNMLTDVQYEVDIQRLSGNVPGIARQALVNKALKQSSAIAHALAQFAAENDVNVDDTAEGMAALVVFLETLKEGGVDYAEIDLSNISRLGDKSFSHTGDVRAQYPAGKRLRFNGADTYLCRVFGAPTYAAGVTTITVWFDATTTIPATITKLERSRLTPQDTANGGLIIGTDTDETIQKLFISYCCGSYAK